MLPAPIDLDSLPGYRKLVTEPATFLANAPQPEFQRSNTSNEDHFETPLETFTESDQHKMGLFSAFTGNISAPDKDKKRSVSQTNTSKPTASSNAPRATEAAAPGSGTGITTGDTVVPAAVIASVAPVSTENHVPADSNRSVIEERSSTPTPNDHTIHERSATPVNNHSIHERSATPVNDHSILDRSATPGPETHHETERASTPAPPIVAIEHRHDDDRESTRESVYAPTATTLDGFPSRPSVNNEQPSRSYLKTNDLTRENSRRDSVRSRVVNDDVLERAPAVLERTETGTPAVIDRSTASATNLGDREHVGQVIVLPAGGGLTGHNEVSHENHEHHHEQPESRNHAVENPVLEDRESINHEISSPVVANHEVSSPIVANHEIREAKRDSIISNNRKSVEQPREVARSIKSVKSNKRVSKDLGRQSILTNSNVNGNTNGSVINGASNGYPYEKAGSVRNLMSEGQAYRQDGMVPGQPTYTAPQPVVPNSYAPIAGGTAGGMIGAAVADGYRGQQQQGQYPVQQQGYQNGAPQQQYQQQPQQYKNDSSFAAERAMSPGPEVGLSRLSVQEPANSGSNIGPSPGPPVTAFKPTAPSPSRLLGASAANGSDLGRANTYRTGVSRGNTVRRGGAFANGSALSGGGVSEAYSREDIHERNDLATRNLIAAGKPGAAVNRKISVGEKKDAKRMSKMIVKEGQAEAAAVKGAMRELESLQKMQKAAAGEELKAQKMQTKALQIHDKAYKKFLKQKEAYDRVEAELRSKEEQYEMRRQHAQAQTETLAAKSAELNDLRAQKAADDREREMRLLALKNPGAA